MGGCYPRSVSWHGAAVPAPSPLSPRRLGPRTPLPFRNSADQFRVVDRLDPWPQAHSGRCTPGPVCQDGLTSHTLFSVHTAASPAVPSPLCGTRAMPPLLCPCPLPEHSLSSGPGLLLAAAPPAIRKGRLYPSSSHSPLWLNESPRFCLVFSLVPFLPCLPCCKPLGVEPYLDKPHGGWNGPAHGEHL